MDYGNKTRKIRRIRFERTIRATHVRKGNTTPAIPQKSSQRLMFYREVSANQQNAREGSMCMNMPGICSLALSVPVGSIRMMFTGGTTDDIDGTDNRRDL